jgi:hypothetical protein
VTLSVVNARKLAAKVKAQFDVATNPQAEQRAIRDEMTFAALLAE